MQAFGLYPLGQKRAVPRKEDVEIRDLTALSDAHARPVKEIGGGNSNGLFAEKQLSPPAS